MENGLSPERNHWYIKPSEETEVYSLSLLTWIVSGPVLNMFACMKSPLDRARIDLPSAHSCVLL
jgi:hypothetical protein